MRRIDPDRLALVGTQYQTGVVSWVGEDGWPVSVRVPLTLDARTRQVVVPEASGAVYRSDALACLTVHSHAADMTWQRNMQIRGRLHRAGPDWAVSAEHLVGGFEIPPGGVLRRSMANARKATRFRRNAKREYERWRRRREGDALSSRRIRQADGRHG